MEMFKIKDTSHLEAMNVMKDMMKEPNAMNEWFDNKRKEFNKILPKSNMILRNKK
jgi:hypothetical protein